MNKNIPSLRTVDGAVLMSQPLRPPNFVVDTLLAQGLQSWQAPPRWASPGWLCGWL